MLNRAYQSVAILFAFTLAFAPVPQVASLGQPVPLLGPAAANAAIDISFVQLDAAGVPVIGFNAGGALPQLGEGYDPNSGPTGAVLANGAGNRVPRPALNLLQFAGAREAMNGQAAVANINLSAKAVMGAWNGQATMRFHHVEEAADVAKEFNHLLVVYREVDVDVLNEPKVLPDAKAPYFISQITRGHFVMVKISFKSNNFQRRQVIQGGFNAAINDITRSIQAGGNATFGQAAVQFLQEFALHIEIKALGGPGIIPQLPPANGDVAAGQTVTSINNWLQGFNAGNTVPLRGQATPVRNAVPLAWLDLFGKFQLCERWIAEHEYYRGVSNQVRNDKRINQQRLAVDAFMVAARQAVVASRPAPWAEIWKDTLAKFPNVDRNWIDDPVPAGLVWPAYKVAVQPLELRNPQVQRQVNNVVLGIVAGDQPAQRNILVAPGNFPANAKIPFNQGVLAADVANNPGAVVAVNLVWNGIPGNANFPITDFLLKVMQGGGGFTWTVGDGAPNPVNADVRLSVEYP